MKKNMILFLMFIMQISISAQLETSKFDNYEKKKEILNRFHNASEFYSLSHSFLEIPLNRKERTFNITDEMNSQQIKLSYSAKSTLLEPSFTDHEDVFLLPFRKYYDSKHTLYHDFTAKIYRENGSLLQNIEGLDNPNMKISPSGNFIISTSSFTGDDERKFEFVELHNGGTINHPLNLDKKYSFYADYLTDDHVIIIVQSKEYKVLNNRRKRDYTSAKIVIYNLSMKKIMMEKDLSTLNGDMVISKSNFNRALDIERYENKIAFCGFVLQNGRTTSFPNYLAVMDYDGNVVSEKRLLLNENERTGIQDIKIIKNKILYSKYSKNNTEVLLHDYYVGETLLVKKLKKKFGVIISHAIFANYDKEILFQLKSNDLESTGLNCFDLENRVNYRYGSNSKVLKSELNNTILVKENNNLSIYKGKNEK
ncbi:MAG: hypothetical protein JEY94_19075 [Melioribacteraceae bacterium]|nr:hypothetical protein [Melioribacteraceae bacterium]